jgi:hypothetical protein
MSGTTVAPWTAHKDAYNSFYQTCYLRGFLVFHRPGSPRLRPDGARFSIGRSIVYTCVFAVFLSEGHLGAIDGPSQGSGRSTRRCFSKKLLLSGIIYGILDNRFRIVVDELMHL